MEDKDWSKEKGIADELHFNEFVVEVGGELLAPLITRPGVANADYLFRSARIVAEHKMLETDFAQTPHMLDRVDAAIAKYPDADLSDPRHPLFRDLFSLLRVPLRRIIEKANKQIREAKLELGLRDHRGLVFLVNDAFRSAPPALIRDLILSILVDRGRYRSVDAVIYLTNHFVEVSEVPFATLLWAPTYKAEPSNNLWHFVDWLGERWSAFMNERIGPFEGGLQTPILNWDRMHVVNGVRRVERYDGDD